MLFCLLLNQYISKYEISGGLEKCVCCKVNCYRNDWNLATWIMAKEIQGIRTGVTACTMCNCVRYVRQANNALCLIFQLYTYPRMYAGWEGVPGGPSKSHNDQYDGTTAWTCSDRSALNAEESFSQSMFVSLVIQHITHRTIAKVCALGRVRTAVSWQWHDRF